MGDQITILDALLVTVVSLIVVFGVLILISYLIGALKTISEDKKDSKNGIKEEVVQTVSTEEVKKEISDSTMEAKDGLNEELVAVIAAAVAANLGLNIPDIRIKGIRRVPQTSNTWSAAGKRHQILDKF